MLLCYSDWGQKVPDKGEKNEALCLCFYGFDHRLKRTKVRACGFEQSATHRPCGPPDRGCRNGSYLRQACQSPCGPSAEHNARGAARAEPRASCLGEPAGRRSHADPEVLGRERGPQPHPSEIDGWVFLYLFLIRDRCNILLECLRLFNDRFAIRPEIISPSASGIIFCSSASLYIRHRGIVRLTTLHRAL